MSEFQAAFDLLDDYITRQMKATRTPGLTLALFDRANELRLSTYGLADPEAQIPVQGETLFGIGSITKTFTAVAVLQAVEQGLLDLTRPITDYLPWFQVKSQFGPISLTHLLTHTAGLIGVIDRSPDVRGAAWALRETETAWPPGSEFYYSDAGYQLLGLVLEKVIGQPLDPIFRTRIFEPLGMRQSEPAFVHAIRPRMARGYQSLYDDRPQHADQPLVPTAWFEMKAGDCCIASTAADLAKFARMLLNQGQGPPGSILSAAGCDLLSHQARPTPYGFAYGHGLQVHQREGFTCLAHGGGMPGYGAFILVDPASGLGTTLMCTTPALDVQELAWKALTLWHQAHLHQPLDKVDLSIPNPMHVENAADFAGTYHGPDQTRLTFFAKAGQLILADQPDPIILESRGADRFYIHHPHFDRFLLHFKRAVADGDRPGPVIEAHYGPDCYARDGAPATQGADCPPAWDAYPGHYRAHIPWQTNFRIILRKGALWLVWPGGSEEPLLSLANDHFQIGDELSPERLRFGPVVDGQALSANYSGSDYYRFFVP